MTARFGPDLHASGFVVLRTPLLPFDELLAWSDGVSGAASLDSDRAVLRDRLRALVARPDVEEALFVASPRLHASLRGWRDDPDSPKSVKVERALVRYVSRMSARPTPFGLFAGWSTGTVARTTTLELGPRAGYRRHTRLDMEYLSSLVEELERDRDVRRALVYRPNSGIHTSARRLRYPEARMSGGVRSHHLVAVDETSYLRDTLERAADGARIVELAAPLVDEEITEVEAEDFIHELIDSQLLVSDLAPPVTGPEPIHSLVARLEQHGATSKAGELLEEARVALDEIDAAGLGTRPERYYEVAGGLERLPARVELHRLFQVDMVKPAPRLTLGEAVVDQVADAVRLLHRICGRRPGDDALARFRVAFTERYGDREVGLAEALDEEVGVGFEASRAPTAEATPLLAGLAFPSPPDERVVWGRRNDVLLAKVMDANARGLQEIELTAWEIDDMAVEASPLPGAFSGSAVVGARSHEDVERGHFSVFVQGVYGPSGARLLGRFCHADDALAGHVKAHLRAEEARRPDAVFAEIVHLPEGRMGNILLRPLLRDYEIPYLGRSGASEDDLLAVTDLVVTVVGERVVLRSRRLDREVVPRLTSAHNYTYRSLGVYRFLCALQGVSGGLTWSWGPLDGAPFLPRVRHGRVVRARARWLVEGDELPRITSAFDAAGRRAVHEWRERRGIPRFVMLVDGDNELLVDWDNALLVESLLVLVEKRPRMVFAEMWPTPDDLCAAGPEGRFTSEVVVPFVVDAPVQVPKRAGRASAEGGRRSFAPGSEWLYAKLYSGTATADRLVRELVLPFVERATSSGDADSWFFVRFGDPDWHLRLRLHGPPGSLVGRVLPDLHARVAPLIEDGLVWRVQLDTYEREADRYGGPASIELAERIFCADSNAAASLVSVLSGDEGMDARWRLTLKGVDLLMDDFGLDHSERQAVVVQLRDALAREFGVTGDMRRRLGQKYRDEQKSLQALLDATGEDDHPLHPGLRILGTRSAVVIPIAEEIRRLETEGELTRGVPEIVRSMIHMHANRVLRSAARAQELVIYELLDRLYRARIERARARR
jgi:thiopeptide-type bacteriocin biosynthesis protein